MSKAKWIWAALLVILYTGFWVWYGGNGDPISQAEGEKMLARVERVHGVKLEDTPKAA